MSLWIELGIVVVLTLVNGVFSGAEIAMLSIRRTRLQELADEGRAGAAAALALRADPERMLATVQVGITVIGATTAAFGGTRLARPIAAVLEWIGLGSYAEAIAFALVVAFVSYLSIVLGELVPKSLALAHGERFALFIARALLLLSRIAGPAVWSLTVSSNLVLRPFRDRTTFSETRLSPEELQQLVEEAAATGALAPAAGEIASRAIDLAGLQVTAVMVPRTRIVSLALDAAEPEIRAALCERPHARYPVYDGQPENIVGYVVAREVFGRGIRGERLSLRGLVKPVTFVPSSTTAVEVLRDLQGKRQQLAVVVDEVGGIEGLVTIEDVAEELLGEILEEHEHHQPFVQETPSGRFMVLGDAPIHEVERAIDESLDAPPNANTIGGLIASRLGRIPATGESVDLSATNTAAILEATERAVKVVKITKHEPPIVEAATTD